MLQDPDPRARLEARLAGLERENRRMRWAYLVLLLTLLGSCARKTVPPEIVAREFKVVDDQGSVYATLGVAPWNKEGLLTLHNPSNAGRRASASPTTLTLTGDGSSVQLEAGEVSLLVMHDQTGWTGAKLSTHAQRHRSSMWLTSGRDSIFRSP